MAIINIQFHHLFHEEHVIDKSKRNFQRRFRTSRGNENSIEGENNIITVQDGRNYSVSAAAASADNDNNNEGGEGHKLAGLKCQEKYGGPEDAYAEEEMVFWSDIPSDASYKSPFMDNDTERYLAFEP